MKIASNRKFAIEKKKNVRQTTRLHTRTNICMRQLSHFIYIFLFDFLLALLGVRTRIFSFFRGIRNERNSDDDELKIRTKNFLYRLASIHGEEKSQEALREPNLLQSFALRRRFLSRYTFTKMILAQRLSYFLHTRTYATYILLHLRTIEFMR